LLGFHSRADQAFFDLPESEPVLALVGVIVKVGVFGHGGWGW
jgi:hypothetical protein